MSGEEKPQAGEQQSSPPPEASQVSYSQTVDDPYGYGYDPYAGEVPPAAPSPDVSLATPPSSPETALAPPAPPPPASPASSGDEEPEDGDEDMLRMSFLEHLEELRSRLIKMLAGLGVGFLLAVVFANDLWNIVRAPAAQALTSLGFKPDLAQITPMDGFTTIWVKLPLLTAVFLASPWILYQVWSFIAPGLYKRERRWAGPFVIVSAGLFISGGLFAYFVAFRFGLTFLLGIGKDIGVMPVVSLVEYFDLFVNVTLGIGLLFELPVLIFFLVLLRLVTPGFLIANSRYAILLITLLAAVVTPTPDVVNLTIFAVPMILLYFVGIFAGWLLVLQREGRKGALRWVGIGTILTIVLIVAGLVLTALKLGYHFSDRWPFLVR